ncbi:MAG: nitrate reductase subunit beta [Symbiobacteriia bacterium]
MKIKAQMAMVINLDKCIGCHTCSVTCKNVWTNRPGAEYMWWNNVETKPGIGYPKVWEDQEKWRGGWETKDGRLQLKSGGQGKKMLQLFVNPDLPTIEDYYQPYQYDYQRLTDSPASRHVPSARPRSAVTGEEMEVTWGPNWEDDLAGGHITGPQDPSVRQMEDAIRFEFEEAFMMYLPRLCEHCINAPCVAACPSGAIYKREEDGVVLVDQEVCRGWRMCVSSCPYKKVYFNWKTHKAEKCNLCYPRLEAGLPTICSETCSGRVRYLGLMLYDADRVQAAASVPNEKDLLPAQLDLFLDPSDPAVARQARQDGIPEDWIEAAQRSPVYKLIKQWGVALPLHPEYRTLPAVWYVPPLSPITRRLDEGSLAAADEVAMVDQMRIPVEYLANLVAAGDGAVVRRVLRKLVALRTHMRARAIGEDQDAATQGQDAAGQDPNLAGLAQAHLSAADAEAMYRLLALAKYEDRFVVPAAHKETAEVMLDQQQGSCGLDFQGC